ncbi:MAG: sigma-54-dependent Fis family transcriptional regulator [Desulfobacteraceae bacterium]|jgi:DNA-binding NtrC family response regulator|nr:MAG: sigma-54-dependent Fis family transcriptional regulator [Desulfobacteraceae bacterium]
MKEKILVIDDDRIACEFLQEALSREGYSVEINTDARDILERDLSSADLIISDIRMPEMDGLQLLRHVISRWPLLPVILVTAYGSLETTMEAFHLGAWDYISKPFTPDDIRSMVKKVLAMKDLRQKKIINKGELHGPQFVGSSSTMVDFYKQIARVADAWASVLIEGESGTGKELTARSLHQLSSRAECRFVPVNCSAIPDQLLESELFGYEKGAFTGADHMHQGLLESAEGGTLFLDEITEMSLALQGKLLRFMQDGEVRRLGGNPAKHLMVRVVAATNRDIDEEVQKGKFRSDLLYRFVVRLKMPPLRSHKEDLPQLTDYFLRKTGYSEVRISDDAMEILMDYDWPGNVRELQNVIQQTLLLSPFALVLPEHLPEKLRLLKETGRPLLTPLERSEMYQILQVLRTTGWNQSRAAQVLGIDRKTLRSKIARYRLSRGDSLGTSANGK